MSVEAYLPLLASITGVLMIITAILIVRSDDLVYASASLAVLGILNAMLIALLGYSLVAAFLVIVYVGAAVMFIIITVSMIGGRSPEKRDEFKGLFTGALVASAAILLVGSLAAFMGYTRPVKLTMADIAQTVLSSHADVIAVVLIALAATLVEAIAITRRG
jgi:NADH-quinone oxidoreductase subunit J